MKLKPRPAIHMEKPLLMAWVGPLVGGDGASGDIQGEVKSISQVNGVSNMAPTCWFCGSVRGEFGKGE